MRRHRRRPGARELPARTADPSEIRIGYAISKTGPYAGGASTTVIPNYQLWAHDLAKSGGLLINGKRVPVKVH